LSNRFNVKYLGRFPVFLQPCFVPLFTDGILFLGPDGAGFTMGRISISNSRSASELSVCSLALEDPESSLTLLGTGIVVTSVLLELKTKQLTKHLWSL
jgi:hypothetical protein